MSDLLGRLRRSLAQRGLGRTALQVGWAAVRPCVLASRRRRSAARARALAAGPGPVLLHLGSGPDRRAGWTNVDLYFPAELCLDLTRPLPFPDASVDAIYSQHFVEHLTKQQTAGLLLECARVLRPGGWLRISTPDLEHYWHLWREESAGAPGADSADAINEVMRLHDHLYIYDLRTLAALFAAAGLEEVGRQPAQKSRSSYLEGLESRGGGERQGQPPADLIVEGRRPPLADGTAPCDS